MQLRHYHKYSVKKPNNTTKPLGRNINLQNSLSSTTSEGTSVFMEIL